MDKSKKNYLRKNKDFSFYSGHFCIEQDYSFPQGTALSPVKSKPGCAGSQLEPQARTWGCLSPWRGAPLTSNGKHISDWNWRLLCTLKFKWDANFYTGIPLNGLLVFWKDIYLLQIAMEKKKESLANFFAAFRWSRWWWSCMSGELLSHLD